MFLLIQIIVHSFRAKLYITRVHQNKEWIFLLQFITEHLTLEEQESTRRMKQKRRKSICNSLEIDVMDDSIRNVYYPINQEQNSNPNPNYNLLQNQNKMMNNNKNSTIYFPSIDQTKMLNKNEYLDPSKLTNLSYQQLFNFYMKDKLFPESQLINTSIYQVKQEIEDISNSFPVGTGKRKRESGDNDNIPVKKKRRENDSNSKGNVIEDEEILKSWFGSNGGVNLNNGKATPKGIIDLLN